MAKEKTKHSDTHEKKNTEKHNFVTTNRVVGIGVFTLALTSLVFIGAIFFEQMTRAKDIAEYLPADKTLFIVQIDTLTFQGRQIKKILEKNPVYNANNLEEKIALLTGVDFEQNIAPWLGSKIGIAFLKSEEAKQDTSPIIFIETKDTKLAIQSIKKFGTDYEKNKNDKERTSNAFSLYDLSYNFGIDEFSFVVIDKYLVIGNSARLNKVGKIKNNLKQSEEYIKIKSNLPAKPLAFSYLNTKIFLESYKSASSLQDISILYAKPFLNLLEGIGAALTTATEGVYITLYAPIKKSMIREEYLFRYEEAFNPRLTNLINPSDIILYSGGVNLTKQLKRLFEISKELHPTAAIIAEGILQAKKTEYFGKDISLEADIYPLFEDEYALSMYRRSDGKPALELALRLKNPETNIALLKKLQSNFLKVRDLLEPETKIFTLPDGTQAKELVIPESSEVTEKEEYLGEEIESLFLLEGNKSIHLSIVEDIALFSTDRDLLKRSIEKIKKNDRNFEQSDLNIALQQLKLAYDEVTIFNVKSSPLREKFAPFNTFVSGSTIFDDGFVLRIFAKP